MKNNNLLLFFKICFILLVPGWSYSQQNEVVVQDTSERVILNPQYQNQPNTYNTQKQPTTYVESTPLTESNAERLRKARQEAELQTEQKIVEKLEASRLEDEKRRAELLFGNGFNAIQSQSNPAPPPQQQTVVQPQVQVVAVPEEEENSEELKEEIVNAVREEVSSLKEEKEVKSERYYIFGTAGGAEYSNVVNISSSSSLGVGFGMTIPEDHLTVEGSIHHSKFYINNISYFNEMNQYNVNVEVKYHFLLGRVKPFIGGIGSYAYRKYSNLNYSGYYGFYGYNTSSYNPYNTGSNSSTDAFDVGVSTGVSIDVTRSIAIEAGFKYYKNLTHQMDRNFYRSTFFRNYNPVEEVDYYLYTLSLKGYF